MRMRASISLARPERFAKQSSSWERRHPCLLVSGKAIFANEDVSRESGQAGMPALPGQLRRATRAISRKSFPSSSPLRTSTIR